MNNTIESLGVTKHFSTIDYSVFGGMLVISVLIGVYFGFQKSGQNSVAEYFLGSKTMQTLPISMSLISSLISGLTLISVSSEVYYHGTQIGISIFAHMTGGILALVIFLPVFYNLSLISLYEYLELRFDRSVRILASILFTMDVLLYTPVVIFAPALAITQVSGVNIHIITIVMCAVCVFYTTLGGLKAVVWTDAVQCVFMIFSMFSVVILGIIRAGGFGAIYEAAQESDRLELFNMNPDLRERLSFWSIFAFTVSSCSYISTCPGAVQRFTALESYSKVKTSTINLIIGMVFYRGLSIFVGLVMYSIYKDCDPFKSKAIEERDQILAYFVVDVAGQYPGLPGLFIVGVCSASLSTVSTTLNSMSGTIYHDFLLPYLPKNTTDARANLIMRGIVVLLGVFCVVMVEIIKDINTILEMAYSLSGMTVGPVFGIFVLGVLFPMANARGSLLGGITSLLFIGWVLVGNSIASKRGLIPPNIKDTSIAGCAPFNLTEDQSKTSSTEEVWELYKISVFSYELYATLVSVVAGLFFSYLTGALELGKVHPELLSPLVHRFIPRTSYTTAPLREAERDNVD